MRDGWTSLPHDVMWGSARNRRGPLKCPGLNNKFPQNIFVMMKDLPQHVRSDPNPRLAQHV